MLAICLQGEISEACFVAGSRLTISHCRHGKHNRKNNPTWDANSSLGSSWVGGGWIKKLRLLLSRTLKIITHGEEGTLPLFAASSGGTCRQWHIWMQTKPPRLHHNIAKRDRTTGEKKNKYTENSREHKNETSKSSKSFLCISGVCTAMVLLFTHNYTCNSSTTSKSTRQNNGLGSNNQAC